MDRYAGASSRETWAHLVPLPERNYRQASLTTEEKVAAAQELYREAKKHKRASAAHQRRARSAMTLFKEFCADLQALGITVVIEKPHMSEGDKSDRRGNPNSR